jgi:hypothetical protein
LLTLFWLNQALSHQVKLDRMKGSIGRKPINKKGWSAVDLLAGKRAKF